MRNVHLVIYVFMAITGWTQTKVRVSMTEEEVGRIYPDLKRSQYEKIVTMTRPENIFGLEATWQYRFENGKLTEFGFDKYFQDDQLTAANFEKCLVATKQLVREYTALYGKPQETLVGDTTFVDPYLKHHWGYDVMDVLWNNYEGMKINVHFKFFGGKGVYFLFVKAKYFDKDSPDRH